jgi:NitT/TauT family transport system permease protein
LSSGGERVVDPKKITSVPFAGSLAAPSGWARLGPKLELLVVPAVLLALWVVASQVLGSFAAAGPIETGGAIVDGFREGWLTEALQNTLVAAVLSFAIAAALGLALGLLLGLNRFWGLVLDAPLLWIYAIPKITLYPIFLLLLGLTLQSRIAFAVFHGFIPLAIFTANGVRSVPRVYMKVGRVYRLSRSKLITRIIVPSALPAIVVGLRYCFSLTFVGLIYGEMFASNEGMGSELVLAIGLTRVPDTFGIALVLVLIALLVNAAFICAETAIERRRASGPSRKPAQANRAGTSGG